MLAGAETWPQFRGPGGAAAIDEAIIPLEWSADKNVKWKTELPGPGSSSPVFWENKLFVTCYTGYGTDQKEVGINQLGDESDFNATPALAKDALYMRSNKAVYCIAK
jgi:hypothetical protein